MGHERVGVLPKTQRWQDLVQQIANFYISNKDVSHIVEKTINNVRFRFRYIQTDMGVKAAFQFLVAISVASRFPNPQEILQNIGIEIPDKPTSLSLAKAVHIWVLKNKNSLEYGQLAQSAAIDAIAIWYEKNSINQLQLFSSLDDPFEVWRKASNGAGFCELARIFFAKFTERYLNYFLEREASAVLQNIYERDYFNSQIQKHIEEISKHAFETAKITQSFSAGWFNKNTKEGIPTGEVIEGFLTLAFGKIREELRRESVKW